MIQDISPRVFSNAYNPRPARAGDYVLFYDGGKVWLADGSDENGGDGGSRLPDSGLKPPLYEDVKRRLPRVCEALTFLFHVDGTAFYYAPASLLTAEPNGKSDNGGPGASSGADGASGAESARASSRAGGDWLVERPSGVFRGLGEKWLGFAGITACHLAGWYERNRLCGRCGGPMRHSEKERMVECPKCAVPVYPGISPAVIVGVTDGDRLLLTRYANRPRTGGYALIAGFGEIGETIEDTVRREVMEEVGLRVKNLRFYKSQPWGFSSSMLFGFYCDLDGGDEITLDATELAVAEWHTRGAIAPADTSISLTSEMIETFRRGKEPLYTP